MRVINVSLNELETKLLMIGFQGENEITQVRIDAAEILTDYPTATPTLIVKPLFGFAYPVIVAMEGTDVVWEIDNSVLSFHGDGEIQLTFTEGTVIAKSYVGRIRIKRSLTVTGEAPDPIETWEQAATAKLAEVDAQISELEGMVDAAEAAKDEAQEIVDDAAADIQAAGAAQVQVVQAKGTEVLNSIPSDYSTLSGEVTDLKSALNELNDAHNNIFNGLKLLTEIEYDNQSLLYSDGSMISDSGYAVTKSIKVSKGDVIQVTSRSGGAGCAIAIYSSETISPQTLLQKIAGATAVVTKSLTAKYDGYARFSYLKSLGIEAEMLSSLVQASKANLPWRNKKIVVFGDSRTAYDGIEYDSNTKSEWAGRICVGFQATMKSILGTEDIVNEGVSGNTSIQICNRIKEYDFTGVDAVLLEGGVNDFAKSSEHSKIGELLPIGSNFNTNTIYGAWQSAIEYIQANYPSVAIFMDVPAIAWMQTTVFPIDIAYIKMDVANLYNIPCKNMYKDLGIAEINRDFFYCDDPDTTHVRLHFNDYGNKLFGTVIAQFMNTYSMDAPVQYKINDKINSINESTKNGNLNFELINNSYVDYSTGNIVSNYSGYKRTDYIPVTSKYLIVDLASPMSGSSRENHWYDENKNPIYNSFRVYAVNPYEQGINGYRNIITVPENAKYVILSGTNAFMDALSIKNTNYRNDWTWLIASSNSAWAKDADVLCHSTKDDGYTIYKFMTDHHSHHDIYYFAPDSVFTLRTPVKPYSDTSIKSDGAKFTQPNMVTKNFAENANVGATNIVLENITDLTFVGMWLYIVDDSGNYESNEIVNYNESTNTLALKFPLHYTYTTANNAVVKSANSCFLFDQSCKNVEVDGVTIDWNVENNPQQTYNPDFVQDGFSLDQAKNIRIKNCTILNGGRRGICGYDATNILVENCYIENWSEHGIDWYCTRGKNGNTATLPILIDAKVINTVCCNNALCGIQNHRGSGVSIIGCELYGNAHGLRMQEYAHDISVTGCIIRDNTVTGVNILSNSNKLSLVGNIITKNGSDGVQFVNANKLLVANNQISRNGQRGIYLESTHQCEIDGNHISNNNLNTDPSNNDWYFAGIGLVNSNYNKVANNYCSKDDGTMRYGIYERSSSNNNVINDNYTLGSANGVYTTGANSINRNNDLFAIS